jgi:hypothetical protein
MPSPPSFTLKVGQGAEILPPVGEVLLALAFIDSDSNGPPR